MNKKKLIGIGLATVLCIGTYVSAASEATPGSVNDPLATKSYVDSQLENMIGIFQELLANNKNTDVAQPQPTEPVETPAPVSSTYKVLGPLPVGTIILGGEGTEVILRSGKALAKCPGENGLSDVTQGTDITNEKEIPLNHLLIIPRQDGRGITITHEAYLMIRGDYTIE